MTLDDLIDILNIKLHDCVFCGLPRTEAISFPTEYAEELYTTLLSAGLKFVMSDQKVVLFTTGIQLDKSFADGQV